MNAGSLRHVAHLQNNAGTQATLTGSLTDAWTNVRLIWVGMRRAGGGEQQAQQQTRGETQWEIMARYAADITPDKRLLIGRETSTLGAAITTTDGTSITLSDSGLTPDSRYKVLRIEDEFLTVTAGWGTTTLTVTRGAFGSTAATHANGSTIIRQGVFEIVDAASPDGVEHELILTCKERF